MRQKIAAGNWKMNLSFDEGLQLARSVSNYMNINSSHTVILAAPFVYLKSLADLTFPIKNVHIAAQNCHFENSGAFTGEVSVPMLSSINIDHVIVGHSERRTLFGESDAFIKKKVDTLIDAGKTVIFCCGESLETRKNGEQEQFVERQLRSSLLHLEPEDFDKVIIAYEPVWAIGTGETASPEQAQDMHAFIRRIVGAEKGASVGERVPVLYGGSVKPENAGDLFGMEDVDGGLVGGASLVAEKFIRIIDALN